MAEPACPRLDAATLGWLRGYLRRTLGPEWKRRMLTQLSQEQIKFSWRILIDLRREPNACQLEDRPGRNAPSVV